LTITIRMTFRSAIVVVMEIPGGENPGNMTNTLASLGHQSVSNIKIREEELDGEKTRTMLALWSTIHRRMPILWSALVLSAYDSCNRSPRRLDLPLSAMPKCGLGLAKCLHLFHPGLRLKRD
jgi:hypothetical protein